MTTHLDSAVVADYLLDHPHFFEEHAELLSGIKLTSPLMGRAISLQERQMEILREKIRSHELQAARLMHIAQDNDAIAHKFQLWTYAVLRAKHDANLPQLLVDELVRIFNVPQATLRLWDLPPAHATAWYAEPVSAETQQYAKQLTAPFCDANPGIDVVNLLPDATNIKSAAIMALRPTTPDHATGLLIIGSPEPERFTADMSTDFLSHIGETASAALSHIYHTASA